MDSFFSIVEAWLKDVRRTRRPKTVQSYEIAVAKLIEELEGGRFRVTLSGADIEFASRIKREPPP